MKRSAGASAHAVLEYVITRAVLQGKVGRTEVTLPLVDLCDPDEGITYEDDAREVSLKITILTDWVQSSEEDLVMTDYEEGELDGNGEPPGTDTSGH